MNSDAFFSDTKGDYSIGGLEFQLTCYACPEQYDVYFHEEQVGYVRLRHGRLTCCTGGVGGDLICEYNFSANEHLGVFPGENERIAHLTKIASRIRETQCTPEVKHELQYI